MSALVTMLKDSYDSNPLNTAVAITGASTALYGMAGAKKLNQGDLATLQGAILLSGVPVCIYVGNQIIRENLKSTTTRQDFSKFHMMALPAAVSVALGVVSWFVPAKKEAPKLCYDGDSSCSSSCSSDDDDELEDSVDNLVEVLKALKDVKDDTKKADIVKNLEKLALLGVDLKKEIAAIKDATDDEKGAATTIAVTAAVCGAKHVADDAIDEADKKVKKLLEEAKKLIEDDKISDALDKAEEAYDEI